MTEKEYLDCAIKTLREGNVFEYTLVRGAKHLQLRWEVRGEPRMHTICGSPSDQRGIKNLQSDIRKSLRADGLLVVEPPKPLERKLSLEQRVARLEQLIENIH